MVMTLKFTDLEVGSRIPDVVKGPLTRSQIALFAVPSGDHNPIHLDDEVARQGGLPGVIAHGMLNMAYLSQALIGIAPQRNIREFSARFLAMAFPGDIITCTGEVTAKKQVGKDNIVELKLAALNQKGEKILDGSAQVALP